MYAPKTYTPLELIHCEKPFVKVLRRSLKDVFCEGCHERKTLKACRQCLAVNYCSKDCQKADWGNHKLECQNMKNLQKGDGEDFVRMIGRIILKFKGKQWKSIQVPSLGSVATFDDINSNSAYMREDPLLMIFCKQMKKLTARFIGEENMPEEDDMIEIIGKVKYNTFTKLNDTQVIGFFIFIGASLFGHECIPTACFAVTNNVLKVWAIKKINKRTEKITISFRKVLSPKYSLMDDTLVKRCKCGHCTLPYGTSLLTKILNEDKAYSVIVETKKTLQIMDVFRTMNADFTMGEYFGELLAKQVGVLGQTNVLHLRLLAFKCFNINDAPLVTWMSLKELEKVMRMVFGEYYLELEEIYATLVVLSVARRNIQEVLLYYYKIKKMTFHISD